MHSFLVGPDAFDVVVVSGKDAERFLQGQLTCNVAELADNHWTHGACCNNKGRVIATFVLVRQRDSFYLCMTHGVGPLLSAALQKFLPFYKCSMTLEHSNRQLLGLAGDCIDQVAVTSAAGTEPGTLQQPQGDEEGWLCRLDGPHPRALWWSQPTLDAVSSLYPTTATREEWEALALLGGHYPFSAGDSGEYTPQDLHLDLNGYVSFTKGCYTGQEIVARLHYRGKLKKQLCLLLLASLPPQDGAKLPITDAAGAAVGSLLLTRPLGARWLALAQLPAEFPPAFNTLDCAGHKVIAGSLFDGKVIQLSTFFSS